MNEPRLMPPSEGSYYFEGKERSGQCEVFVSQWDAEKAEYAESVRCAEPVALVMERVGYTIRLCCRHAKWAGLEP